jgi:hypothetical protein
MRTLWRYRLTVATGLAVLALASSVFAIAKRQDDNERATRALCALRENLVHRGQQANDFLHEHPQGALGIPPAVIVKSIRDTRGTLRALRPLHC